MQALLARQADRRVQQRRAGPASPPAALDERADLAEAVPGGLDVEHPDDLAVSHRHDRAADGT